MAPHYLYVPLTRMNFVAAIDAEVLAPSGFFMNPSYHKDFTEHVPGNIIATSCPSHPSESLGEPGQNDGLSPTGEDKTAGWVDDSENLHFPLIAKIELPKLTGVKAVERDPKGEWKPKAIKEIDTSKNTLFFLPFPVPVTALHRVFCPGAECVEALKIDPFLGDRELEFEIEEAPEPLKDFPCQVSDLSKKHLTKGVDLERLERCFSLLGGTVMLAEATRVQDWEKDCTGYVETLVAIDRIISNSAGYSGKKDKLSDARDFDELKDRSPDLGDPLQTMVNLALKGVIDSEEPKFEGSPEDEKDTAIKKANEYTLSLLILECMKGRGDTIAPIEIINDVISVISTVATSPDTSPENKEALETIVRGLELVFEISKGNNSSVKLFQENSKDWFAVRMACLFVLRPNSAKALRWPVDQRPGDAKLTDFLGGLFLVGLYQGFNLLPRDVKNRWKSIVELSLMPISGFRNKNTKPVDSFKWDSERGLIKLNYSLKYDKTVIPPLSREYELKELIVELGYRCIDSQNAGNITEREKMVFISLAKELRLWLGPDYTDAVPDYRKIVGDLEGVPVESVPRELLTILLKEKGVSIPVAKDKSSGKTDKSILRPTIDSRFRQVGKRLEAESPSDTLKFNRLGMQLAKKILDTSEKHLTKPQLKNVEEVLVIQLTSFDMRGLSLYDSPILRSWIFLADYVTSDLCKQLKKKSVDDLSDELENEAHHIIKLAKDLYGDDFV